MAENSFFVSNSSLENKRSQSMKVKKIETVKASGWIWGGGGG